MNNATRRRHKLSQSEFAEKLGIPTKTLANWEQGRNEPRGLARIALKEAIKK